MAARKSGIWQRWGVRIGLVSVLCMASHGAAAAEVADTSGPLLGVGFGNASIGGILPLLMAKFDESLLLGISRGLAGFAGWRVNDHLALVAGVDVQRFGESSEDADSSRSSAFTVVTPALGARMFLGNGRRVVPYLTASIGTPIPWLSEEETPAPEDDEPSTSDQRIENLTGVHLAAAVGAEWRIAPQVSLGAEYGMQLASISTHYDSASPVPINGNPEPASTHYVSASTVDSLARVLLTFTL